MKDKIITSIKNYEKALNKLHEFIDEPIVNERDRAGIIQAFEFTFELAWKTFQKVSKDEKMEIGGPKTIIKQAFRLDLVENSFEDDWNLMLEDRNLMSHTYKEDLSYIVSERIKDRYVIAFDHSLKKLKERYE